MKSLWAMILLLEVVTVVAAQSLQNAGKTGRRSSTGVNARSFGAAILEQAALEP